MELNGLNLNGSSGCRIHEDPNELRQRIEEMEKDQEELNSSLMALTSHFAKVTSSDPRSGPLHLFLKNGPTRPLFNLFSSFQTHYNFYHK